MSIVVVSSQDSSSSRSEEVVLEKLDIIESLSTSDSCSEDEELNLTWKDKWRLRFRKLFAPALESRQTTTIEERRFVRKLDIVLMTYGCIAYCIKSIDQSNYLNAYVSGMKEDVSFHIHHKLIALTLRVAPHVWKRTQFACHIFHNRVLIVTYSLADNNHQG